MKAEDILILDMRSQVSFCDYFVIVSGNSERHVSAIAENIEEELDKLGISARISNGKHSSNWVVFDAGDIIAHIFQKDARSFYNLESLWQDARQVSWQ